MSARETAIEVMRVMRHRHDRYDIDVSRSMTVTCKCDQAFVITPGSRTLYEQWCAHVETCLLDALLAARSEEPCPTCGGSGEVVVEEESETMTPRGAVVDPRRWGTCRACGGTGTRPLLAALIDPQ